MRALLLSLAAHTTLYESEGKERRAKAWREEVERRSCSVCHCTLATVETLRLCRDCLQTSAATSTIGTPSMGVATTNAPAAARDVTLNAH